jgi:hypothetical protein
MRAYMDVYMNGVRSDILSKGSVFEEMPDRLVLEFFSERGSKTCPQIQPSENLRHDPRIIATHPELSAGRSFPERAPFVKAVVSIFFPS